MCYSIAPDEAELLKAIRHKHKGNADLIEQFEEGFANLKNDPYHCMGRIIPLGGGMYRYKHGRCRIIYQVRDRAVEVLRTDQRDKNTYKGIS